jgi:hypothetical protein
MQLTTFGIPKSLERLTIAPLGDFQWAGHNGPTAKDTLKRHIDRALKADAYFVGMGDYIDFVSPSNRKKLKAAGLYDVAEQVLEDTAMKLMEECFEEFLKPTVGRWMGIVEGHHFFQGSGWTTDEKLAEKLKCPFLGTAAYIRIPSIDMVFYVHHGVGSGVLPGVGLNKLYHVQGTLQGADIYLMGHNTKLAASPLGRTFPIWGKKRADHELSHRNVWLVNTGGFSRSLLLQPRGGYAEQGMMVPSPLRAPLIEIELGLIHQHFNEAVWVKL